MIGDGLTGYLVLLAVCLIAHESWRWAGLLLGRTLSVDGLVFRWVQLVATALVAALVMRLVVFPAGLLADIELWARLAALGVGVAVYLLFGRALGISIAAGTLSLVGCVLAFGA